MINQTPNNSSKRNNIKSMSSNVSNPGSKSEIATLVDLKTNSFKMAKSGPGSVGSVDSATVEVMFPFIIERPSTFCAI